MNNISQSVDVLTTARGRRLWSFIGPAGLVAVGYRDPGNWATDIEGGARFGHELLWVLHTGIDIIYGIHRNRIFSLTTARGAPVADANNTLTAGTRGGPWSRSGVQPVFRTRSKIGILLSNLGTPDATDYWSMRRYLS